MSSLPAENPSPEESALQEAARWSARAASGLSAGERRTLQAWLRASPLNAAALDAVETGWRLAGEAAPDLPRPGPRPLVSNGAARRSAGSLPWAVGGVLAAACVAGVAWLGTVREAELIAPQDSLHRVVLADGTRLTLDRGAAVRVRSDWLGRNAYVVRGRAEFAVAHERRPFTARTNDLTAHVVGTRFVVTEAGEADAVVLVEGSLRVVRAAGAAVLLRPGQKLTQGSEDPRAEPADIRMETAWTAERLEFVGTRLDAALAAFARSGAAPTRIEGQGAAGLTVSGAFRSTDLESFLDAAAAVHGLEWRRERDGYVLRSP